jgi:hypothetical protein
LRSQRTTSRIFARLEARRLRLLADVGNVGLQVADLVGDRLHPPDEADEQRLAVTFGGLVSHGLALERRLRLASHPMNRRTIRGRQF